MFNNKIMPLIKKARLKFHNFSIFKFMIFIIIKFWCCKNLKSIYINTYKDIRMNEL